ncbi:MAG: hypothetical protein ABIO94_06140 [Opitutaceae bacterium]
MRPLAPASNLPQWLRLLLASGLVFAASLRASWSTLDRYFVGDDFGYVSRFHQLSFREWPALFFQDWSGGMWGYQLPELRPFAALTFLIDAQFWGINPLGYHLTNLLLDAGCACLVGLIVWRLHSTALWLGCAAGILFAWHPAHAEPVAWITGRVDLLSTLAYLAGFFAGGRYLQTLRWPWLPASWLAYGIGCFSKEFCLTLPVVLLLWAMIYRPLLAVARFRQRAVLFAGFIVVAAAFLLCRRLAFGPGGGGVETLNLLSAGYAERQVDYLRWFLPPLYHFGRDFRPQLIVIAPGLVGGLCLVSLAVLALWRWKGPTPPRWRAVTFYGVCWYAVATLPLAAASYFSPRHLYLGTAGLSIAVGLLVATIAARRWLAWGIVAGAALFSVSRFDHAVTPWRHAAKLSERVSLELVQLESKLRPGEILLLDAPDVFEGVWMWSWSVPFTLQPPFLPSSSLARVALTRPATYYAAQLWARQPALAALTEAPGALLVTADDKGVLTSRHLEPRQFHIHARELVQAATADSDSAWKNFVSKLSAR